MFRQMDNMNWGESQGLYKWFLLFLVIDLVLRGFALWRSARQEHKWWFIALLVINSLGILPGIYLLTHRESQKLATKKKK